ncbi:Undecaprenyl phosphate-aminoarabinose flippase subunit ArnF [Pseudomonas aeruginosa]|nr:Undecaprenyl phosphate-aminoarabinose flippase subunit ArnF [Pseudomonas aeruginosa]
MLLARRGATAGGYRLVLVGIGVGASLSGLNSLLLVTGNLDQAMYAQLWLAGSLNTRTWSHVVPAALGLLASVPLALYHGRRLEVLELGDASAAQLGMRWGMSRLPLPEAWAGQTPERAALLAVALAVAAYAASLLCWLAALRHLPLGRAYSLLSASYALVYLLAASLPAFDETFSTSKTLGVGLVVLGVLTVNARRTAAAPAHHPSRKAP